MTSQGPVGALQIRGERTNRQDVRTSNVMAVLAVANIVKSSLGPAGLDKVEAECICFTIVQSVMLLLVLAFLDLYFLICLISKRIEYVYLQSFISFRCLI